MDRPRDSMDWVGPHAEAHHATLGQVFLAWTVAQPGMTTVLAGARNEAQVRENAGAGDLQLADEEIAAIRGLVEQGWPV